MSERTMNNPAPASLSAEVIEPVAFWETKRPISHEEARRVAAKFIHKHFGNSDREYPTASIPANPDRDDDLILQSYIRQQERAAREREGMREALRDVLSDSEGFDRRQLLQRYDTPTAERILKARAALQPSPAEGV